MLCIGEHIISRYLLDCISAVLESHKILGECFGITGEVDDLCGLEFDYCSKFIEATTVTSAGEDKLEERT